MLVLFIRYRFLSNNLEVLWQKLGNTCQTECVLNHRVEPSVWMSKPVETVFQWLLAPIMQWILHRL
jgi:hypothetical protein